MDLWSGFVVWDEVGGSISCMNRFIFFLRAVSYAKPRTSGAEGSVFVLGDVIGGSAGLRQYAASYLTRAHGETVSVMAAEDTLEAVGAHASSLIRSGTAACGDQSGAEVLMLV